MQDLKQYIDSNPRNKLAFCQGEVEVFEFFDVGYWLTINLKPKLLENGNNIPGQALQILQELLNHEQHEHPEYGKYIAIKNIGILFEPELKIDIPNLLEQYSKTNLLLVETGNLEMPKMTVASIQL